MDDNARAPYVEAAEADKARFLREKKNFVPPKVSEEEFSGGNIKLSVGVIQAVCDAFDT